MSFNQRNKSSCFLLGFVYEIDIYVCLPKFLGKIYFLYKRRRQNGKTFKVTVRKFALKNTLIPYFAVLVIEPDSIFNINELQNYMLKVANYFQFTFKSDRILVGQ